MVPTKTHSLRDLPPEIFEQRLRKQPVLSVAHGHFPLNNSRRSGVAFFDFDLLESVLVDRDEETFVLVKGRATGSASKPHELVEEPIDFTEPVVLSDDGVDKGLSCFEDAALGVFKVRELGLVIFGVRV